MKNSNIQWCDHTFNPWIGCTKVSPGCANCYAEVSTPARARKITWGKGMPRVRTSAAYWRQPIAWNREAEKTGVNKRVFCASLADWLDEEVNIHWLNDLLELIELTPNLDWLLLTKRPQNFLPLIEVNNYACRLFQERWFRSAKHRVWVGTTTENQLEFNRRVPHLLQIPAAVHFLSCEPLLSQITMTAIDWSRSALIANPLSGITSEYGSPGETNAILTAYNSKPFIDWVIVGGESGFNARACAGNWIENIVDQCREYETACFVKQLGARPVLPALAHGCICNATNGLPIIRHPKGGDPEEWPTSLRVREFPTV